MVAVGFGNVDAKLVVPGRFYHGLLTPSSFLPSFNNYYQFLP